MGERPLNTPRRCDGIVADTAVILLNLGGPTTTDDVEPFLVNLFADVIRLPFGLPGGGLLGRFIARKRTEHAQSLYNQIGGASPILELTNQQAAALGAELGSGYDVLVAMRYSPPFIHEIKRKVARKGYSRVILCPLYPQYSFATTRTSFRAWKKGRPHLEAVCIRDYHRQSDFIASWQGMIRATLSSAPNPDRAHLVFSAHSIPASYVRKGDSYQEEIEGSVASIMEGFPNPFSISYQSKVGPVKWLGPATDKHVVKLAQSGTTELALVPIAFVCEHLETLYELDILVRDMAVAAGATTYLRVPTPGTDARFIAALKSEVLAAEAQGEPCA